MARTGSHVSINSIPSGTPKDRSSLTIHTKGNISSEQSASVVRPPPRLSSDVIGVMSRAYTNEQRRQSGTRPSNYSQGSNHKSSPHLENEGRRRSSSKSPTRGKSRSASKTKDGLNVKKDRSREQSRPRIDKDIYGEPEPIMDDPGAFDPDDPLHRDDTRLAGQNMRMVDSDFMPLAKAEEYRSEEDLIMKPEPTSSVWVRLLDGQETPTELSEVSEVVSRSSVPTHQDLPPDSPSSRSSSESPYLTEPSKRRSSPPKRPSGSSSRRPSDSPSKRPPGSRRPSKPKPQSHHEPEPDSDRPHRKSRPSGTGPNPDSDRPHRKSRPSGTEPTQESEVPTSDDGDDSGTPSTSLDDTSTSETTPSMSLRGGATPDTDNPDDATTSATPDTSDATTPPETRTGKPDNSGKCRPCIPVNGPGGPGGMGGPPGMMGPMPPMMMMPMMMMPVMPMMPRGGACWKGNCGPGVCKGRGQQGAKQEPPPSGCKCGPGGGGKGVGGGGGAFGSNVCGPGGPIDYSKGSRPCPAKPGNICYCHAPAKGGNGGHRDKKCTCGDVCKCGPLPKNTESNGTQV